MDEHEPIHVTIPGHPGDPRKAVELPPGVTANYAPALHADDIDVVDGIPVTSVSRTLIDLAELLDEDELRGCFARARERGMLDPQALAESRERVEWRPSLAMLDRVIAELT